jgi:hypothetical protein
MATPVKLNGTPRGYTGPMLRMAGVCKMVPLLVTATRVSAVGYPVVTPQGMGAPLGWGDKVVPPA